MLASLARQTRRPEEVIIVDEDESSCAFRHEFPELNLRVVVLSGSASAKRNAGFRAASCNITLVGFMDDDIVLEPTAIGAMEAFWEQADPALGGTSCNYLNAPGGFAQGLKQFKPLSKFGLYEHQPGGVARSGFHTRVASLQETTYVRWLPSGAAFYAKDALNEFPFDEWFESYSYLEDLDLSYRIGKKYKLAVLADARFYHYPSEVGRASAYSFGKKEVLNRLYFVSKHPELSRPLCCLVLSLRALMSIIHGIGRFQARHFERVAGNLAGFAIAFTDGIKR